MSFAARKAVVPSFDFPRLIILFLRKRSPVCPFLTASIGDILLTLPVQPRQNRRITAATRTAQPILTEALLPLPIIIDPVESSISIFPNG